MVENLPPDHPPPKHRIYRCVAGIALAQSGKLSPDGAKEAPSGQLAGERHDGNARNQNPSCTREGKAQ